MENIKLDHLARTVYDNKEEFGNKFKKQEHLPEQSFLNDIKQKNIEKNDEKNLLIKMNSYKKSAKEKGYAELYDLKNIATNHLSYLDEVRNFQFENPKHLLTEYLKSYGGLSDSRVELLSTKSESIEKIKQGIDLYAKSNFENERSSSVDLPVESKKIGGIPSEILRKNILITKSELFIRNFHGDHLELLKNIKRQLPDSIDRIWLNGKMVWSKT